MEARYSDTKLVFFLARFVRTILVAKALSPKGKSVQEIRVETRPKSPGRRPLIKFRAAPPKFRTAPA